ncbi:Integrin Beta-1 [Manis pentadactyla]|nr:Integrin Beta-1 [Manis pentadactyla]
METRRGWEQAKRPTDAAPREEKGAGACVPAGVPKAPEGRDGESWFRCSRCRPPACSRGQDWELVSPSLDGEDAHGKAPSAKEELQLKNGYSSGDPRSPRWGVWGPSD